MANPRIRKVLDHKFTYGVAYTMNAARHRNKDHINHIFFLYGMLKGSSEYLSKLFGQKKLNKACLELARVSDEEDVDSQEDVARVEDISFSQSVSKCVELVKSGKNDMGLLGAIASICAEHPDAMEIMEQSGISRDVIEKAAMAEISMVSSSPEDASSRRVATGSSKSSPGALAELCTDMTELATQGKLDKTFCREKEIDGVILSLMRKIKNNPLLIGEPGVGKTAIVEGLAYRIVSGDVPPKLADAKLYSLAMSTLVSGTSLRGQFEERLKAVVEGVCDNPNALLFIDEVHMLVGAGDNAGVMDAGNVLKPYLARGELRCIGATTFRDYNRTIKKDGALSRRFHRIVVQEVDTGSMMDILQGLKPEFESFHECKIEDSALERIIDLSSRYITERHFPDKAIDCLDDACARAVMNSTPVDIDTVEHSVASIANVPFSMLQSTDEDRVADARPVLKQEILGNDTAIDEICEVMLSSLSSGKKRGEILCSMVIHGPSGVGKRSILRRLSELMFGQNSILSINGAEFVEHHSVSKLVGSPPGYVGYNEESKIVRQLRRCPHSMILIDGISKMNGSVREQIFDMIRAGIMTTGDGMDIDLGNSVFIFVEDSGTRRSLGFDLKSSDTSTEGLDRWDSYGIFEDIDGVVRFASVDSNETLMEIAKIEVEESGSEWDDFEDSAKEILEENKDASPSKIRRMVRRELEKLEYKAEEGVGSVDVVG